MARPAVDSTEIQTRGRRANARTIFTSGAEQALWRQLDLPEAIRIHRIACCRLLRSQT